MEGHSKINDPVSSDLRTRARRPIRVTYFSLCATGLLANGGSLCFRNHIARLTQDPQVELFVAMATWPQYRQGNLEFLQSVGVPFQLIDVKPVPPSTRRGPAGWWHHWGPDHQFLLEPTARFNLQIDGELMSAAKAARSDIVLLDYLPVARFVPSVLEARSFKTVVTLLNREAEFFRDLVRLRRQLEDGSRATMLGYFRSRMFERSIISRAAGAVAIGRYDMPTRNPHRRLRTTIHPFLDRRPDRWHGAGSSDVYFVGDISHYPNRLAIQWLATKLAPLLAQRSPHARICVLGANHGEVPETWHVPNLRYLGRGDVAQKDEMFRSSALFIAPIQNNFGAKFKVAECASFGAPMIVSDAALSGAPFLDFVPRLTMDNPLQAAQKIADLIADREALIDLGDRIDKAQQSFAAEQQGIWGRTLAQLL